jgi:polygalacturonase
MSRLAALFALSAIAWSAAISAAAPAAAPFPAPSVRSHGAAGDGKTKDTAAIQKAIDTAADQGGGTVHFPPGTYLTGTLRLRSNVTLHLDTGATLLGSTDLDDYPHIRPRIRSYTDNYVTQSILYGEDIENVAIVGRGTIDGQGASFKSRTYENRPYMIRLVNSRDILVENVTIRNSAMWVQHYLACDNVTVRGINVHSRVNRNNDMLDIDSCHNVRISDCYGESDDDAITLKSTTDRACENISITNCVVSSKCNGIKMGTESNGGFKNISISNCTVFKTGLAGVALEIVDGGTMDGVTISNISMRGVRVPIFLRLGNRARPFKKDMAKPGMGSFRNVNISNIVATNTTEIGCSITGLPGRPIENVSLSNIKITFPGGGTKKDAQRAVPEHPTRYPECTMFGTLPAYGFYCRHVTGLTLWNIDLRWEKRDERPALVCDDVTNSQVGDFRARSDAFGTSLMHFRNVVGMRVRGCVAPTGTPVFLRLSGQCDHISVVGNDLRGAEAAFAYDKGTSLNAVFPSGNRLRE